MLFKVRAAAVFALGTYILNTGEDGNHTDQATSIDHSITVELLTLLTDGSPIVRQVSYSIFPIIIFIGHWCDYRS